MTISIHAPREGSDKKRNTRHASDFRFLSTLPARGATFTLLRFRQTTCISIHAPREGSDIRHHLRHYPGSISIHAPREGSDKGQASIYQHRKISIHAPREGSDLCELVLDGVDVGISIHAPREGSDGSHQRQAIQQPDFYPRSPRGERPFPSCIRFCSDTYFYPRSPRGERR